MPKRNPPPSSSGLFPPALSSTAGETSEYFRETVPSATGNEIPETGPKKYLKWAGNENVAIENPLNTKGTSSHCHEEKIKTCLSHRRWCWLLYFHYIKTTAAIRIIFYHSLIRIYFAAYPSFYIGWKSADGTHAKTNAKTSIPPGKGPNSNSGTETVVWITVRYGNLHAVKILIGSFFDTRHALQAGNNPRNFSFYCFFSLSANVVWTVLL